MTRSQKNRVTIFSREGMLGIRFNFKGKLIRRSLSLPDDSAQRIKATEIASKIELAILSNTFELEQLDSLLFNQPVKDKPVTRRSGKSYPKNPKRSAFSNEEVKQILNAFYTDQFKSKYSNYKHSDYAKFIHFLFLTGCRISEAIGLQIGDIDWNSNKINITKALARSESGQTSSKHRRYKEPKTRSGIRILPMNDSLKTLLQSTKGLDKNLLVFPSPTGKCIDDHNFLRVWRKVLNGLNIPYRVPYAIRHTRATNLIESGLPINQVSYILGHADSKITLDTYVTNRSPENLPEL